MVKITFTRYKYDPYNMRDIEETVTYGPFDWVEVEVPVINAEANGGEERWEQLAVLHTPVGNYHWRTADNKHWRDFVVSEFTDRDETRYPKKKVL